MLQNSNAGRYREGNSELDLYISEWPQAVVFLPYPGRMNEDAASWRKDRLHFSVYVLVILCSWKCLLMPEVQHLSTYFIAHNTLGLDIKEERNIVRLARKSPSPELLLESSWDFIHSYNSKTSFKRTFPNI